MNYVALHADRLCSAAPVAVSNAVCVQNLPVTFKSINLLLSLYTNIHIQLAHIRLVFVCVWHVLALHSPVATVSLLYTWYRVFSAEFFAQFLFECICAACNLLSLPRQQQHHQFNNSQLTFIILSRHIRQLDFSFSLCDRFFYLHHCQLIFLYYGNKIARRRYFHPINIRIDQVPCIPCIPTEECKR